MAPLKPGSMIWVPCEVKPGPFSNERLVQVKHLDGTWVGFVNTQNLREVIDIGQTAIKLKVSHVEGDVFWAIIPGHSLSERSIFKGHRDRVAVQA